MAGRRSPLIAAVGAVLGVAIGVAGCGGSESAQAPGEATATAPTRQAAAGDMRTCPEKTGFTFKASVKNLLAVPIRMEASEYDCNDWDGASTPGRAFTGQVIQPGEKRTFTLQPARNTTRNWTMEFTATSGVPSYGRARLTIPRSDNPDGRNFLKVTGAKEDFPPGGGPTKNWVHSCEFFPMERTGAPDAGWEGLEYFSEVSLTILPRKGFFTLASYCVFSGGGA